MTNFRASLSALATGTLVFALMPMAFAQNSIDITGAQAEVDGACVAAIPAATGVDCSFDATAPYGGPVGWEGPVPGAGYYAVGTSPYQRSGGAIGDEPTYGAGDKLAFTLLAGSEIQIDDGSGGPPTACAGTNRIAGTFILSGGTRAFAGGPGENGEETWADGDVTIAFDATTVTSATVNGGGCDYEIASQGFPQLLEYAVAPPGSEIGSGEFYVQDIEGEIGAYVTPTQPADDVQCGSDGQGPTDDDGIPGNCGVRGPSCVDQPTLPNCTNLNADFGGIFIQTGPGWSCQDNTNAAPTTCGVNPPNAGACETDGPHYCGARQYLENILVRISVDGNGDISSGMILAHNESRIFNVGPPAPKTNSWDGAQISFSGTCSNCSLVRDDSYTYLTTDTFPKTLDIGANDSGPPDGLQDPTTVTITTPPNQGGTVNNISAPGNITAMTVDYTPAAVVPVVEETFVYNANDGTDQASATVTVTIETDIAPTAPNSSTNQMPAGDVRGVDNTTLEIVTDVVADLGATGNAPLMITAGAGGQGTTIAAGSVITYTPGAAFFAGTDSYTYTVDDQGTAGPKPSAPGTVTVEIPDVDPGATDTSAETEQDTAINDIAIEFMLGNGSLAQHTVDISDSANGSCQITSTDASGADGTGTVTYVPDSGFFGTDICTFTVTDGDGGNPADGDITITVNEDTLVVKFPGGSAMDPLSLFLLLGLPLFRRRRQCKKPTTFAALVLLVRGSI